MCVATVKMSGNISFKIKNKFLTNQILPFYREDFLENSYIPEVEEMLSKCLFHCLTSTVTSSKRFEIEDDEEIFQKLIYKINECRLCQHQHALWWKTYYALEVERNDTNKEKIVIKTKFHFSYRFKKIKRKLYWTMPNNAFRLSQFQKK